jgi:hypothetical protein
MKRLALLLLWASAAFGQQVQTIIPAETAQLSTTIALTAKTPSIHTWYMYGQFGTSFTITDSVTTWTPPNTDDLDFQLSGCTTAPSEQLTVKFSSPAYWKVIIGELAGCYAVKDIIPSRSPTNPSQSLQYQDGTSNPCSFPLNISVAGELVIGYNNSDSLPAFSQSQISAEPGWTLAGFRPQRATQWTVVANPGPVESCFTQPYIVEQPPPSGGLYATEGIVGLVQVTPPAVASLNATLTVKYEDGTVPTIYAFGLLDITSNPQISVLYLQPDPTTGIATGAFLLSSADTYQGTFYVAGAGVASFPFQGGPILTLIPQISTLNWTVILCKTSCPAGAIKELVTDTK